MNELEHIMKKVLKRVEHPFYFYNLDQLKAHLENITKVLDPDIKLWYACKANPLSAILKILRNLNFGIDIASMGELEQVMNVGIPGDEIIATGPAKSKKYLETLIDNNVTTIVIESLNQLKWLNQICIEKNIRQDVLLRLQLEWEDEDNVLGANKITPFGLGFKDWSAIDLDEFTEIDIRGFHIFQWGNILSVEKLTEIWSQTIEKTQELCIEKKINLDIIDIGGGLGVPYLSTQSPVDIEQINNVLTALKKKYKLKKIWMELGRFTVAECGYYLTKITDIKKVRGKDIIVTEGGINHCARVAITSESFPCSALDQSLSSELIAYQVHGPLCTSIDMLGEFDLPKDLKVDDWLVFSKAGAYGFTESMPYFLGHPIAAEVIYYNGDVVIPRPTKNATNWMV